ncbi:hypothetical protein BD779DRAFT_1682146 [Infundibulicybe gibba]|nr:hypothetical protein BD779DRAFT_1682146 [Infundibulicybe gibba]
MSTESGVIRERHVFRTDTDPPTYYMSPNTSVLPPVPKTELDTDPNIRLRDLRQPRWLNDATPYLAFLHKTPHIDRGPFFRLVHTFNTVPIIFSDGFFILEPDLRMSWMRLEYALTDMMNTLMEPHRRKGFTFTWLVSHPAPQDCGYRRGHHTERAARGCAMRSIDSFMILIAMAAFSISLNLDQDSGRLPMTHHNWCCDLIEKRGVHPEWIQAITDSFAFDWTPGTRVGAFMLPMSKWAPYLTNFERAGIPIWIYWSNGNINSSDPYMQSYKPKAREVHDADRTLANLRSIPITNYALEPYIAEPSSLNSIATDSLVLETSEPPKPRPGSRQKRGETWAMFRSRMEELLVQETQHESVLQRTSRHSREAHAALGDMPGRRGPNVFRWVDENGFKFRTAVPRQEVPLIWEDYAPTQRRYDAVHNEWDLIEDLDTTVDKTLRDIYREFEMEYDDDVQHPDAEDLSPTAIGGLGGTVTRGDLSSLADELGSVSLGEIIQNDMEADHGAEIHSSPVVEDGLLGRLAARYGFVDPGEGYITSHFIDQTLPSFTGDMAKILPALGHKDANVPRHMIQPIKDMYNLLLQGERVSRLPWRIFQYHGHNRLYKPIQQYTRINVTRLNRGAIFMLIATVKEFCWDIVLYDAPAVVEALVFSERSATPVTRHICAHLVTHGIAFNTVVSISKMYAPSPYPHPVEGLGWRPADYVPDIHDYLAYEQLRKDILRGPAGRAALLRGGILWRLARESVNEDEVLRGPSGAVEIYGKVIDEHEHRKIVDDGLDSSVEDVICGVYRVQVPGSIKLSLLSCLQVVYGV